MPIRDAVLARTDRFTDETGVGVVDVPAEEDLNPLQLDGLVVSLVADSEEETNLERLADVLRTAFPGLRTAWEYAETGVPVLYDVGRSKVARFYLNISKGSGVPRVSLRMVSGQPAIVTEPDDPGPRDAPRVVTLVQLDHQRRLAGIYSVLATRKLAGLSTG